MVLIHSSRDVTTTLDSVWNVISDIDREPEFWHGTKSIKNISKTENTVVFFTGFFRKIIY